LLSGEFIDRDVTPLAAGNEFMQWKFGDVDVAVTLPSWVMVMPDGWPSFTSFRHRNRCRKIHWNRPKVFDNDKVDAVKDGNEFRSESLDIGVGRTIGSVKSRSAVGPSSYCEVGDNDIDVALARNGLNLETQSMQRGDPCIGHDGHSIGSTETKRKHSARGH